MNRKVWYGILAILPFLFFSAYFIAFFSMFLTIFRHAGQSSEPPIPPFFITMFLVLFLTAIAWLADIVIFLIHVVNDKAVNDNERLVWVITFIFAGFIAFPVYWYMRIYKSVDANSSLPTQPQV